MKLKLKLCYVSSSDSKLCNFVPLNIAELGSMQNTLVWFLSSSYEKTLLSHTVFSITLAFIYPTFV